MRFAAGRLPAGFRWLTAAALALGVARADPASFRPVPTPGTPAVVIRVPYTLGTHEHRVATVRGGVRLDPTTLTSDGGHLVARIDDIVSESPERDCHLREAIGLDYSFSRFPREHVCDGANRLPTAGPDAVAYPEVTLDVLSARPLDPVDRPSEVRLDVAATWTLRGVSRPAHLSLSVSRPSSRRDALRVRGRATLRLDDFGIVVKSARALFVTISAGEVATAEIDVLLAPASPTTGGGPG